MHILYNISSNTHQYKKVRRARRLSHEQHQTRQFQDTFGNRKLERFDSVQSQGREFQQIS